MGYFSNGTEGMIYEAQWCDKCVHQKGCAVWNAHMLRNYDECNKEDSILHMLIPRTKGGNGKCTMFIHGERDFEEERRAEQYDMWKRQKESEGA